MTVAGLQKHVRATLAHVEELFFKKNETYRSTANALSNFFEGTPVRNGRMSALQYAHTLMAKQDTQLEKAIWESQADPEFEERAMDGIVYRILLLAIRKEAQTSFFISGNKFTEEEPVRNTPGILIRTNPKKGNLT